MQIKDESWTRKHFKIQNKSLSETKCTFLNFGKQQQNNIRRVHARVRAHSHKNWEMLGRITVSSTIFYNRRLINLERLYSIKDGIYNQSSVHLFFFQNHFKYTYTCTAILIHSITSLNNKLGMLNTHARLLWRQQTQVNCHPEDRETQE